MPTFRAWRVLALLAPAAFTLGCGARSALDTARTEVDAGLGPELDAEGGPELDAGMEPVLDAGPELDPRWVPVPGVSDAIAMSVGEDKHSCALRKSGGVLCWGKGGYGQLGDGNTNDSDIPVSVSGLEDAVAISAGLYFSCALRATGEVACWGRGGEGQLGNGRPTETEVGKVVVDSATPVLVDGLSDAAALSTAQWSEGTCALRSMGEVVCWGGGEYAGLGRTVATSAERTTPEFRTSGVLALSVGVDALCVVRNDGEVVCGDVGSETPVPTLRGAVAISAGLENPCAVLPTGDATCQFGVEDGAAPVALPERDAVAIAAGRWSFCALRANGQVSCWGKRLFALVGTTEKLTEVPTPVVGLNDAVAISLRVSTYADLCAVRADGSIVCWDDPG